MKTYQQIGLLIAGIGLGLTALVGYFKSHNDYTINNPNLKSNSRSTAFYEFTNKAEYTKLKDGSEEILIRDKNNIFRYQNFNGDDEIDRIRIDRYSLRDIFRLENILIRSQDYLMNKSEFDKADKILLQERKR